MSLIHKQENTEANIHAHTAEYFLFVPVKQIE